MVMGHANAKLQMQNAKLREEGQQKARFGLKMIEFAQKLGKNSGFLKGELVGLKT